MNENIIADKIYKLFQSGEYDFWSVIAISKILNYDISTTKNIFLNDKRFRESYFRTRDGEQNIYFKNKKDRIY